MAEKSLDPGTHSTLEDVLVRSKSPQPGRCTPQSWRAREPQHGHAPLLRTTPAASRCNALCLRVRLFPPQALNRVRLIRGALAIGFSVRNCRRLGTDHGGAPCHHVRDLAREKLAAVEVSLRSLQVWRRELKTTLATWDRLLRKTPEGQRARLLETFVASHPTRQARYSSLVLLPRGNQKREKSQ